VHEACIIFSRKVQHKQLLLQSTTEDNTPKNSWHLWSKSREFSATPSLTHCRRRTSTGSWLHNASCCNRNINTTAPRGQSVMFRLFTVGFRSRASLLYAERRRPPFPACLQPCFRTTEQRTVDRAVIAHIQHDTAAAPNQSSSAAIAADKQ